MISNFTHIFSEFKPYVFHQHEGGFYDYYDDGEIYFNIDETYIVISSFLILNIIYTNADVIFIEVFDSSNEKIPIIQRNDKLYTEYLKDNEFITFDDFFEEDLLYKYKKTSYNLKNEELDCQEFVEKLKKDLIGIDIETMKKEYIILKEELIAAFWHPARLERCCLSLGIELIDYVDLF